MSTITKQWLQQKIAEMEAARDDISFGLGEDGTNTLAALRIALASLEAEAVCVIDQSNLDYLKSGSDADVWPASRTEMGDVLLYRAVPPAPVSVPDDIDTRMKNAGMLSAPEIIAGQPIDAFMKHAGVVDLESLLKWSEMRRAEFLRMQAKYELGDNQKDDMYEWVISHVAAFSELHVNIRAAMLQGAEPVTTACKLRDAVEIIRNSGIAIDAEKILAERDALNAPDCWCRTCRPVTMTDMRFVVCPECGNKRCPHANDHRNACTGSNEPGQEGSAYPAAPQQEVK